MDRLAHRVLAGPGLRSALALRRPAPEPERQVPELRLRRTAGRAEAYCGAPGAL
jgi:hypothetical protein